MKAKSQEERRGQFPILAVLVTWLLAMLACSSGAGVAVSPDDTRLQPPTVNSGLVFTDFLAQVNLFPRGIIPIPWIVTPESPAQFAASLAITGWGPGRQNRPWPGDPARSPVINIYQLSPEGCDGAVTKSLLATTEVSDTRNWGATLPFSQPSGLIAATARVGENESGLSNMIVIGEGGLKPTIYPIAPIGALDEPLTLAGTGPAGYCVALVRDGQLDRFYDATIGQDGRWMIGEIPSDGGNSHAYQVRLLVIGLDSDPVTGSATVRPDVEAARRLLKAMPANARHWSRQVEAPIRGTPGQRSASLYADVIDQFDVSSADLADRYQLGGAGNSDTRCNIFAGDVMRALGVPLPTKGNLGKGQGNPNSTYTDPMTAQAVLLNSYFNRQIPWVTSTGDSGVYSDWIEIDPTSSEGLNRLIAHVAAGKPAIVSDSGHIAVVRPEQLNVQRWQDLNIAQAGAVNTLNGVVRNHFRGTPQFYIHE